MFGYIGVNSRELKGKEMERYQAYYCGLCRSLKDRHGAFGQLTLSYDTTFLVIVLTGLYEPENREYNSRCILHPFAGRNCIGNAYSEYAADMNVMLSYFKCLDDWEDEKKVFKLLFSLLLKGKSEKVKEQYKKKATIVYENLKAIHDCEQNDVEQVQNIDTEISNATHLPEYNLDTAAGYFGKIMEELFSYRSDEWDATTRQMGFYLGKFLYLMDAYDDMERDVKTGNYNPVLMLYHRMYDGPHNKITYVEPFEKEIKSVLRKMMAESAKAFERLPIIEDAAIIRNILYSGVWTRYEAVAAKRKKQYEEEEQKKQR